jgi:hypothetical protein
LELPSHGISSVIRRTIRAQAQSGDYYRDVGARTIRRRDESVRQGRVRQENLTLGKIIAALAIPLFLAFALAAMDMRSDLDQLRSSGQPDDKGAVPMGWSELTQSDLAAGLSTTEGEGPRRVRMIGYMMDGNRPSRDREQVSMFILLPEAGQLLHPAHRIPNLMVEVWPLHSVNFRYRQLVWVSGTLNRTIGSPGPEKAAFE